MKKDNSRHKDIDKSPQSKEDTGMPSTIEVIFLKIRALRKIRKNRSNISFEWFPKTLSNASREGDSGPMKKQFGDMHKHKNNLFHGKTIQHL